MPTYVVEAYVPRSRADGVSAAAGRAQAAAAELSRVGVPVRYVRTTFLPDDETCFHLFEAESADAVAEAAARASLGRTRIVAALEAASK